MTAPTPARDPSPVTTSQAFLNHASISPLPRAGARAVREFTSEVSRRGMDRYDVWMARVEETAAVFCTLWVPEHLQWQEGAGTGWRSMISCWGSGTVPWR